MRGTPVRYQDFRGGLNTADADYLVSETECRDCRNMQSDARGSIRKRRGHRTFSSSFTGSPSTITSLFSALISTTPWLIATGAAKVYSVTESGTNADITGALTLTSEARWEFTQAPASGGEGPVYGVNGTDPGITWTGSGNAAAWTTSSAPTPNPVTGGGSANDRARYIATWDNRVYLAGSANNPNRVWWSDVGDPRAFPASNITDFDPNDGDVITGLGRAGPYLLVFKRNKVFQLYDSDTTSNRVLDGANGCVSQRSIVETPIGLIFLSTTSGVMVTNGTVLRSISDKIDPTIHDALRNGQGDLAAGGWYDGHYYLALSTQGTGNDLLLDYDSELRSWWLHDTRLKAMCALKTTSGDPERLYGASAAAGRVERLFAHDELQDYGATFYAYWLGPWLTFKEPYRLKRVREINFDGFGWLNVAVARDFAASSAPFGTVRFSTSTSDLFGGAGTFGGDGTFGPDSSTVQRSSVFTPGVARSWALKLTTEGDDATEVESMTWLIQKRKD